MDAAYRFREIGVENGALGKDHAAGVMLLPQGNIGGGGVRSYRTGVGESIALYRNVYINKRTAHEAVPYTSTDKI